jgi:predicted phage-related endonuclease
MGIVNKPEHGSYAWLKLRHRDPDGMPVVSASEAAAVHNEHKYLSKYQLAVQKVADEPPFTESNRAMERGNRLEPVLIDWVGDELGVKLSVPEVMFTYYAGGMIATLDAVDHASKVGLYIPRGADSWAGVEPPEVVVEIKTLNRSWDGVLPRYWYWQGVQQAICAHVDQIVWGVFDSSLDLHVHIQQVSYEEKARHAQAVREFLDGIRDGEVPAGWATSYEDVSAMHSESKGGHVDLSDYDDMIVRLRDVQRMKKGLAEEEEQIKAFFGQVLGANESGVVDGVEIVSWKPQTRKSFDQKRFAEDHPALYAGYQTSSTFRVMRFKGEK